jgi:hypothetical protein
MKGRIEVIHGFIDAINFLTGKFQDLYIVSTDSPYIRFVDSAVQTKLANRIGDGVSVTVVQANTLSNQTILNTLFRGDTNIVNFNELGQYFNNISTLDADTFNGCSSLESIDLRNISNAISDRLFLNCSSLSNVLGLSNIESIGYQSFKGCQSLGSLSFSNKLKTFDIYAFTDCTNLKTISNETIYPTLIKGAAFYNCNKFTGPIDLSLCTTYDGGQQFYNCSSLKSVGSLNTNITAIPTQMFYMCGLESLGGLDNVIDVGESAFRGNPMSSLNFSNKLKYIRKYAFVNCKNLETISNTIIYPTQLLESAFNGCDKFNGSLNLSLCQTLENGVFMGTLALQSITIDSPDITVLADSLFKNSGIQTINGLQYVTTVNSYCFANCKSITSLEFSSNLKTIRQYAFNSSSNLVSISSETITPTTLEWQAFAGCTKFKGTELNLSNLSTLNCPFHSCTSLVTVNGLENIDTIVRESFRYCTSLTHLNFSNKLKIIQWSSFQGCSHLETISDDVIYPEYIGENAFNGCTNFIGPIDLTYCTELGNACFSGCGAMKINIGPNLNTIIYRMFDGSNLKEIYIPSNITQINGLAFAYNRSNELEITMQSSTPPTLTANTVFQMSSGYKIYVPNSAVETYKAATYWSTVASAIHPVYDAQVEYIESTGTQWIDTDIIPTATMYSQIKFNHLINDGKVIYGFICDDDSHSRGYIDYRYMHYANNTYFDIHGVTDNGQRCQANNSSQTNAILEIELGNHYIKNIATNTILAITNTMAEADIPHKESIKLNNGNNDLTNCRWYYIKIYDNNNLILDLIPVRRGAIGMMYDRVSGKVFKNNGTGNFVLGNDI